MWELVYVVLICYVSDPTGNDVGLRLVSDRCTFESQIVDSIMTYVGYFLITRRAMLANFKSTKHRALRFRDIFLFKF